MTKPKIIYIAGYGRSGSTLLDTALSNHAKIFGVGELSNLWRIFSREVTSPCSCGEDVIECAFWKPIRLALEPNYNFAHMHKLRGYCDGSKATATKEMQELYAQGTQEMLELINREADGWNHLVDSSKTTRLDEGRPAALKKLGYDVYMIHVVRDPRAVIWSNMRSMRNKSEYFVLRHKPFVGARTALTWWLANRAALKYEKVLGQERYLRISYKDFCNEPQLALERFGKFLDLDFGEVQHRLDDMGLAASAHQIAGNLNRLSGGLKIKYDDAWEAVLPLRARLYGGVLLGTYKGLVRNLHSTRTNKKTKELVDD